MIEEEGIRRSVQVLSDADLVIYMIDTDDMTPLMEEHPEYIYIWNKSDIREGTAPKGSLPLCSLSGEGFSSIEKEIITRLGVTSINSSGEQEIMIDSLRQKELLDRGVSSLHSTVEAIADGMPLDVIAPDVQDCIDALGEITGEITSADILDTIFSGFCVGK